MGCTKLLFDMQGSNGPVDLLFPGDTAPSVRTASLSYGIPEAVCFKGEIRVFTMADLKRFRPIEMA